MNGMNKTLAFFMMMAVALSTALTAGAQEQRWSSEDSAMVARIHDHVLGQGGCVEDLRVLCKEVGARLSGSPEADAAILWGAKTLRESGAPEVRMQTVIVPHWERGHVERAWLRIDGGEAEPLKISALGGSIGTEGVIEAPVRVFRQFEELDSLGEKGLDGAIAFFNRPMDPLMISAGGAYGGANNQRSRGAVEAADHGGVAALVRSLTHALDTFPHTGAMRYDDAVHRVPAAAVSTVDARRISGLLSDGHDVRVGLEMGCILHDDKAQANVIAEWTGTEHPDRYIVVGGHLDSWDIGEGAHDDGAGIVHSIEVMRTLVALGYQPRHTIRVVLFINEENGNNGGKTYARKAREKGEWHVAALESDAGGDAPRGWAIDATDVGTEAVRAWRESLVDYGMGDLRRGGAGVDIGPLKKEKPAGQRPLMVGLRPNSQRYFDYHHSDRDVFENVHPRELKLGAAALTSMVYLLDRLDYEALGTEDE